MPWAAGRRGDHLFSSSLPLPTNSQIFRQLVYYCRKLTSSHSQQPDSNRELLFSERKLLTTNVCTLIISISKYLIKENVCSLEYFCSSFLMSFNEFFQILVVCSFTYMVIVVFTFKLLYKMMIKNCYRLGQMDLKF